MSAALRFAAAALLVALSPACKCARSGAVAPPDAGEDEDQVRPVYSLEGPVAPLAAKLCEALHKLPEERRAQCCPGGSGITVLAQCTGTLSSALRLGAVTLEAEAVDRCASAMAAAHEGCAWVGPNPLPLPEVCTGLLKGTLGAGAHCRSSLECQDGLRCAGAGPTDLGRCAPAGPPGTPCELAVDALAVYARQDLARGHPECDGYCQRRACWPPLDGGSCLLDVQCPRGTHCGGGACVAGPVALAGEACSAGGCQAPLRCVQGSCRAPAPEGTPCTVHQECLGACIPADGGSRCGAGCAFR